MKRAFNSPPDKHPLRILIATDAAREGINLQRHCHDLVHFDLPWDPSRLEQRNGRIDRKLQPAPVVTCRYFVFPHRPEDRVLDALVRKSDRIHRELGSTAQVLEARSATMLACGIRQRDADALAAEIADLNDGDRAATIREELEAARQRQQDRQEQIDRLRRQIRRSEQAVGIDAEKLRQALSTGLGLAGAPPIREEAPAAKDRPATFRLPADAPVLAGDLSWAPALDLLREPRQRGEAVSEWRARAVIRPVTFDDPDTLGEEAVQLHLEHRVVRRLLARFASQGLLHLDLTRCCLASARGGEARAILLARLSLSLSAPAPRACMRRSSPSPPAGQTRRFAKTTPPLRGAGEERTLELLEEALGAPDRTIAPEIRARLLGSLRQDVADLRPHIEQRAAEARTRAEALLAQRARRESAKMRQLLQAQLTRTRSRCNVAQTPASARLTAQRNAGRRRTTAAPGDAVSIAFPTNWTPSRNASRPATRSTPRGSIRSASSISGR